MLTDVFINGELGSRYFSFILIHFEKFISAFDLNPIERKWYDSDLWPIGRFSLAIRLKTIVFGCQKGFFHVREDSKTHYRKTWILLNWYINGKNENTPELDT